MTGSSGDHGFQETARRIDVALAVPLREGKILVALRAPDSHQGGLWEFPGGKIEDGEHPADAARRELREETGLQAAELEPLVVVVHDYADRPLRLHVFLARDPLGDPVASEGRPWSWVSPDDLGALEMPEANRQVLRALRWRVKPS